MAAPSNWRPCGAGRGGTALWVGSAGDAPRISSDGPPLGVWGEREKLPLARLNVVRLAQVLGAAPCGETGKDGWRSGAGLRAGPAGHATGSMSIDGADLERAVRRNLPLPRARSLTGAPRRSRAPAHPVTRLPSVAGVVKPTVPPPRWCVASGRVLAVFCRGRAWVGGVTPDSAGLRAKRVRMNHDTMSCLLCF